LRNERRSKAHNCIENSEYGQREYAPITGYWQVVASKFHDEVYIDDE
jgi:hypothetical protein